MMSLSHLKRLLWAITVAGVLSAVVGNAAAHDDHSADQWPTTCVDLNDIVEEHLGNHRNVGIYQRAYGAQAEQGCRDDHLFDIRDTFGWAIGYELPSPLAPRALDVVFISTDGGDLTFNFNMPDDAALRILGVRYLIYGATFFTESTHELSGGSSGWTVRIPISSFNPGRHVFTVRGFNSVGDGLPTYRGFTVTSDGRVIAFDALP